MDWRQEKTQREFEKCMSADLATSLRAFNAKISEFSSHVHWSINLMHQLHIRSDEDFKRVLFMLDRNIPDLEGEGRGVLFSALAAFTDKADKCTIKISAVDYVMCDVLASLIHALRPLTDDNVVLQEFLATYKHVPSFELPKPLYEEVFDLPRESRQSVSNTTATAASASSHPPPTDSPKSPLVPEPPAGDDVWQTPAEFASDPTSAWPQATTMLLDDLSSLMPAHVAQGPISRNIRRAAWYVDSANNAGGVGFDITTSEDSHPHEPVG